MNCFFLWVPFFLIRFGLMSCLDKSAVRRAAQFAPMRGPEKAAYWVYQLSTAALILHSPFLRVSRESTALFSLGLLCYAGGLVLCAASIISFSAPAASGVNTGGMYRYSRNPMYVSYFFYFFGMVLLIQSVLLFCMVLIFQISAHWIVLAEERECIKKFGVPYEQYMGKVRRYL